MGVPEQLRSLPSGWEWTNLGDLGTWTGGGTPSKSHQAYWDGGTIPWVSPKDMKVAVIGETEDKITEDALEASAVKLVPPASVLMVMRSGILKHSFPVAVTDRTVTVNQDLRALTPHEGVLADYLARYLASAPDAILDACSKDGTTVNSIDAKALASFPVPIAPPREQRRIVDRVDELFAEINEGETALADARKGLETFRRALLKAAVTGELTRDWRKRASIGEMGNEFLDRLQALRLPNDSRDQSESIGELPSLPATWAWARLSRLGDFGRGKSRHRPRDDERLYGGAMPFLQTGVVANADDYIQSVQQTYSPFGVAQSRVWPKGTLCITIAANIAKTAITTFDCCFPDSVVGLVPAPGISAYWVHIWMQTIQKRLERFAPATAQRNINLQVLNGVMVPIPPADELAEILRRVRDGLEAKKDALGILEMESAETRRLKRSILKTAFEGRLVRQDEMDEPASVLLKRTVLSATPGKRPRRKRRVA